MSKIHLKTIFLWLKNFFTKDSVSDFDLNTYYYRVEKFRPHAVYDGLSVFVYLEDIPVTSYDKCILNLELLYNNSYDKTLIENKKGAVVKKSLSNSDDSKKVLVGFELKNIRKFFGEDEILRTKISTMVKEMTDLSSTKFLLNVLNKKKIKYVNYVDLFPLV